MPYLQVAVSDAKLGVGNASGHVWMDLWVNVRVDADQDLDRLANLLGCSLDVVQIKLAIHIDQHLMLHGQLQLPGQLTIAIEHSPALQAVMVAQFIWRAGICKEVACSY